MIRDLIHHGTKSGHEMARHAKDSLGDLYLGVNDLFGNFFKDARDFDLGMKDFLPSSDITETEKGIEVKLELPGVDEKDINVTVENNVLIISGEKKKEEEIKKKNYYISERSFGKFERKFSLPDYAEGENITAKFKNGILDIQIPKTKPAHDKVKKITISKE